MQLAALECADEVDPVAQQIGAVNTLIRQQDGSMKGYNTDWSAAISAIERGLLPDQATSSSSTASSGPASADSAAAGAADDLGAEEATTSGTLQLHCSNHVTSAITPLSGCNTPSLLPSLSAGRLFENFACSSCCG